jgi:hypothetical protein
MVFGVFVATSPDDPLAKPSCRTSGADKKQEKRKQEQAGSDRQPGRGDLALGDGNGFGAAALHQGPSKYGCDGTDNAALGPALQVS